jgi:hypothetical protein
LYEEPATELGRQNDANKEDEEQQNNEELQKLKTED